MSPQPKPENRPLTDKQREVLRWIKDGCPSGRFDDDYAPRISARAMARRGFVKITGRGKLWKAEILPKGRDALEKATRATPPPRERNQGDELLEKVIAAGGELELKNDRSEVRKFIEQSYHSPLRPHGRKLVVTGDIWSPQTVTLVDNWDELVEAKPVKVLEKVRRYHPAVKRFKQNKEIHRAGPEHLQRCILILQSIAEEAERRDIAVLNVEDVARRAHHFSTRRKLLNTHLMLEVAGRQVHVTIRERGQTGRLELNVDDQKYRDKREEPLEERLPEVIRRFEVQQRDAEVRKELNEQEEARVARRREVAEEKARERYFADKRWEHFQEISAEWQKLRAHREFLEEARRSLEELR